MAHALDHRNAAAEGSQREVMAGTLAEKVWDAHVVRRADG